MILNTKVLEARKHLGKGSRVLLPVAGNHRSRRMDQDVIGNLSTPMRKMHWRKLKASA
jgi:hypothetical protein